MEFKGEPSYTSKDHKWKGAKANFINKLKIIKDKPHSKKLKLNKLNVAAIWYKLEKSVFVVEFSV